MSSVGVFLFASLGSAYLAVGQMDQFSLELLELAPLGGRSQILARGTEENLLKFQKSLRVGDLIRSKVIVNCDQRTLETYFHLHTGKIDGDLFVFEGGFLGDILEVCDLGMKYELNPIEIRFPRSSEAKINLLMTGKSHVKTQALLKEIFRKNILCHHIKEPGKTLKGLFDFEVS